MLSLLLAGTSRRRSPGRHHDLRVVLGHRRRGLAASTTRSRTSTWRAVAAAGDQPAGEHQARHRLDAQRLRITATITARSASPDAIAVGGYTLPAVELHRDARRRRQRRGSSGLVDRAGRVEHLRRDRGARQPAADRPDAGLPRPSREGLEPGPSRTGTRFPLLPLYDNVWRRFTLKSDLGRDGRGRRWVAQHRRNRDHERVRRERADGVRRPRRRPTRSPGSCTRARARCRAARRSPPRGRPAAGAGGGLRNGSGSTRTSRLKWRVDVLSEPFAVVIDDGEHGTLLRTLLEIRGTRNSTSASACASTARSRCPGSATRRSSRARRRGSS
jgi:hypothetical protein